MNIHALVDILLTVSEATLQHSSEIQLHQRETPLRSTLTLQHQTKLPEAEQTSPLSHQLPKIEPHLSGSEQADTPTQG